ncbi:MAG: TIM barrel protein [Fuerstiella sp.]|nr:TIM barrel protein [Fuerstiella sp.]
MHQLSLHRNATDKLNRREALRLGGVALAGATAAATPSTTAAAPHANDSTELDDAIGIVTASAAAHLTTSIRKGSFTLLQLPQIMREELDLRVIDLNTSSFPDFASVDEKYCERLRRVADRFGCVLTNLKMNQRGIDMNSPQQDVRQKALTEYKRSIDIASRLGCRWARPLPQMQRPDMAIHVASYRELCDYAAERDVTMLVENFGWMQGDPDSVPTLVKAIGHNVSAGVDTGNWSGNDVRYAALARAFPLAATCDFKARKIGPGGEHEEYDLKRCFDIAWNAGFRGPWAFEHGHGDLKTLFSELQMLRDMLRKWTLNARAR